MFSYAQTAYAVQLYGATQATFDQCSPFDTLVIPSSSIRPNFTLIESSLTIRLNSRKPTVKPPLKSTVKLPLCYIKLKGFLGDFDCWL